MDFAPYGAQWTEALAFEWDELDELHDDRVEAMAAAANAAGTTDSGDEAADGDGDVEDDPEFRYMSEDTGIQPSKRNNYGIPKDVVDVYRSGGVETTGGGGGGEGSCTLDDLLFRQLRGLSERRDGEQ